MFGIDDLAMGGLSLLGGVANNLFAGSRQQDQQNFAVQQQQQQEAFQERMSNTAYQRATADMKAAGLNPMMMYGGGSAASSPSGSMATTQAAPVSDVMGPALSTALQSAKVRNELSLGVAQLDNIAKDTRKKVIEGDRLDAETAKVAAETPGVKATSQILGNHVAESVNQRITAEKERPYIDSAMKSILAPTAKAAQDVYKLIPPVRLNVNSGKSATKGWVGGNEVDTTTFNSRFNGSFGNQ